MFVPPSALAASPLLLCSCLLAARAQASSFVSFACYTDRFSEQRHPASRIPSRLPLPLAIWFCGKRKAAWFFLALASPLLPCLNTERVPELVVLRCLGNGGGSCCFLPGPGAAPALLLLRACKRPPLPQGCKLWRSISRDILFILCLCSFIGPYNHPCHSLRSNNSLVGSSFSPLLLHCCSDNLFFVCSSSSHDDQELPQGSSWCAEELGPRLCGSLQLDHGHLLSREPCHRIVSKSPTTFFCVCFSSINVSSVSYRLSGYFHLAEKHQARTFLAFSPQV